MRHRWSGALVVSIARLLPANCFRTFVDHISEMFKLLAKSLNVFFFLG